MESKNEKTIEWVLRVALFGEFLGHGILALLLKESFSDMIVSIIGVNLETAKLLLLIIGAGDVVVAIFALIYPFRLILLWATIWGFLTALARPLSGQSIWDFVERWANFGVPLALLFLRGIPNKINEWFK